MENQPKLNSSKEIIAWLAERFPHCFSVAGEARPLKIGIFQDLIERVNGEINLSRTRLRSAMRLYTSSWRYLYGVKSGAIRVDLDGNACGELKKQHVKYAHKQLEESKVRVQIQRKQQQVKNREVSKKTPNCCSHNAVTQCATLLRYRPSCTQLITDTSALQQGQSIKIKIGKNITNATVIETGRDGVRVQLTSGMTIIVRAEYLHL